LKTVVLPGELGNLGEMVAATGDASELAAAPSAAAPSAAAAAAAADEAVVGTGVVVGVVAAGTVVVVSEAWAPPLNTAMPASPTALITAAGSR
jgi:hypothetical protein